jgi:hypothetical protein
MHTCKGLRELQTLTCSNALTTVLTSNRFPKTLLFRNWFLNLTGNN